MLLGRAKPSKYLPTVLTKDEVFAIIKQMLGVHQLLIKLLYGTSSIYEYNCKDALCVSNS